MRVAAHPGLHCRYGHLAASALILALGPGLAHGMGKPARSSPVAKPAGVAVPLNLNILPTPNPGPACADTPVKPRKGFAIPKLPGGYSVDGTKGRYLCQVSSRTFDTIIGGEGKTLATLTAEQRGEFQDRQLDMPRTTARLQAIVDGIAAQWPYPKPDKVVVRIVGTSMFQAEALPDHSIKVHLGLLTTGESEDEIAFVLAHEYAHIALGHLKRNDDIASQNRVISTLSDAYYYGTKFTQMKWTQVGSDVVLQQGDAKTISGAREKAEDTSQQLHLVLDVLVTPAWQRNQEDQADAIGYDLALKAGFDAENGSQVAFQAIETSEGVQAALVDRLATDVETSLKTAAKVQADAASAQVQQTGFGPNLLETAGQGLWAGFSSTLRDSATKTLKGVFTATHRKADARILGLSNYSRAAWGETVDPLKPPPKWLKDAKGESEYDSAERAVGAVDKSQNARSIGDIPKARLEVNGALATSYRNSPMVLNEQARVLIRESRLQEANSVFLTAHKSPNQSVIAYQDHVNLLLAMEQWKAAKDQADAASERFGDNKPFFPAYVAIGFATRQDDAAVTQLKACITFESRQLKQACINNTPHPETAEFKRLSETNREAVILARGKANDEAAVGKSQNKLTGFFNGIVPGT